MADIFNMADTWNNGATTFDAIKMDVTDTASNAASRLLWLGVGGSAKATIDKTGGVVIAGAFQLAAASPITFGTSRGIVRSNGANNIVLQGNAGSSAQLVAFDSGGILTLGPSTAFVAVTPETTNILAQRNGANAQTSRLYFSYTNASNYTRMAFKTATGIHTIETESAGTGEANIDLALTPKGTGAVRLGTHSAIAAETVTGYITIKDAAGNSRKIAVVS